MICKTELVSFIFCEIAPDLRAGIRNKIGITGVPYANGMIAARGCNMLPIGRKSRADNSSAVPNEGANNDGLPPVPQVSGSILMRSEQQIPARGKRNCSH